VFIGIIHGGYGNAMFFAGGGMDKFKDVADVRKHNAYMPDPMTVFFGTGKYDDIPGFSVCIVYFFANTYKFT
jgi:hypothetical protein